MLKGINTSVLFLHVPLLQSDKHYDAAWKSFFLSSIPINTMFFCVRSFRLHILSADLQQVLYRLYKEHHPPGAVGSSEQHPPGHQDFCQGEEASTRTVLPSPPRDILPVLRWICCWGAVDLWTQWHSPPVSDVFCCHFHHYLVLVDICSVRNKHNNWKELFVHDNKSEWRL